MGKSQNYYQLLLPSVDSLLIAKGCVCFLPIAILLFLFIALSKP